MNRRTFFKIIAGAAAAPFVAKLLPEGVNRFFPEAGGASMFQEPPIGEFISIDTVQRAKELLASHAVKGPYVCLVHPDAERDLRDMIARERWKAAYREERITRKKMMRPLANNEIGRIDNVRFVVSRSVT